MASIGKITNSAISATSEITLAAASLNFDFSLVKIEAPPEFQALGRGLSHERRKDAEDGSSHITARKLAALFEPLLDRTPELVKAYGLRVSEIASSPDVNPQGSKHQHGLFFKKVGVDGTSIWAAATSSHSAISVHLLACMLARMWPADEATSIWAEIVEERRLEIHQDNDASELERLARGAAASQLISRDQLAHWDASARAWLQSADQAKGVKIKQTQLLLMLKNVTLPVNTIAGTYKSVLNAWKNAMMLTENLIKGQPQEAHDGAVLLGLSAWHLYPDLVILGQKNTTIKQKDALVSGGGILTLGLHNNSTNEDTCGISWSLPLASLNFYGDPIPTTQSMDPDSSRMTMQQVTIVALGSVLSDWDPMSLEFSNGAECLVQIWTYLSSMDDSILYKRLRSSFSKSKSESLTSQPWRWLKMLSDAAKSFLAAEGVERETALRLVHFGRRRAKDFLRYDSRLQQNEFLGLRDAKSFMHVLEDPEDKIFYLRRWINQFEIGGDDVIIQYSELVFMYPVLGSNEAQSEDLHEALGDQVVEYPDPESNEAQTEDLHETLGDQLGHRYFEYATAIGIDRASSKRDHCGSIVPVKCHHRWIWNIPYLPQPSSQTYHKCGCELDELLACQCLKHECRSSLPENDDPSRLVEARYHELLNLGEVISMEKQRIISGTSTSRLIWHGSPQNPRTRHSITGTKGQAFEFLWGNADTAAIFLRSHAGRTVNIGAWDTAGTWDTSGMIPFWVEALKTKRVNPNGLCKLIWDHVLNYQDYFNSLDALSVAADLYQHLPGATIHPKVTSQALHKALWYESYSTSTSRARLEREQEEKQRNVSGTWHIKFDNIVFRKQINRTEALACIALFEGGSCNIRPKDLQNVMAFSSGSSIYIASQLLQDPSVTESNHEVKRIPGNFGQAGMAFLIPPHNPRVRALDDFSWNVINHSGFDGKSLDAFEGTSCHLSFTNYRMPLYVANFVHGRQDVELNFLEAVVSVYNCGKWVADLDILSTLASRKLYRPTCHYQCPGKSSWTASVLNGQLTSVDSWEEILERPINAAVVRARGNWLARLAMTSFSIGRGYKTIVLPEDECWACCAKEVVYLQGNEVFIL